MLRKIILTSVFLTLIVILLASYIRLSGGQLACPDFPGCFGQVVVLDSQAYKDQAAIAFPNYPQDLGIARLVMGQRYLTACLALMVLLLVLFSMQKKPYRPAAIVSSISLLVLLGLQAFIEFWLIKLEAMPILVVMHMLLGMLIFWLSYWCFLRTKPNLAKMPVATGPVLFSRVAGLIIFLQILLGCWVSANQAGLVCQGFPTCNGQWLPKADFHNALNFFYGLYSGYTGVLSFDAQVAISWLHRMGGLICFVVLSLLMLSATSANNMKPVRRAGLLLSAILFVQIGLSIAGIKWSMNLWVVLSHHVLSALLMLPLLHISFYSRYGYVKHPKQVFEDVPEISVVELKKRVPDEFVVEDIYVEPSPESLLSRLKTQLKRTRSGLGELFANLPLGGKAINEDLLEEIEASLIMADVGMDTTNEIINHLTHQLERHQLNDGVALSTALKQELLNILKPCDKPLQIPEEKKPFVILVVGVNGAGKTTTIGKLAKRLQSQGKSVMLAAGDTFRAAAVEQLQVWGERNNIHVVAQHTGADSASVIYDGVQSALAKGVDVLIADTAGRLHTKSNLMDELKKVKRIIGKLDETAPHEVLLVLDAGTGQNALSQAKLFNETVALTGLVLTKLDGTAKGGVIFALAKQTGIPIRFIGIGEGIDDLQDFDAANFVDALFVNDR